jgi:mRNA-degrading endonuclease RelE of RelBE toxin-antitoxin system
MDWRVLVRTSVVEDARWFGRKQGRWLLGAIKKQLSHEPLTATLNNKLLRPNLFAERELRLGGRYRVLFNVDSETHTVAVLVIGEKRGEKLFVRGKEFTAHHESDPAE